MIGSWTETRPLPCCLDWYMATSARRSSSSAETSELDSVAMPALAPTTTGRPPASIGWTR